MNVTVVNVSNYITYPMVKKSKHKYYFYQSECQKSKGFTKVKSKNQRGSTHFPSPYDKILIIQYYNATF